MPRNLDTQLQTAMQAGLVYPARLASLAFRSKTVYVWSGPGPLVWNGQTFQGIGSLGTVSTITEGMEVNAEGTSVTLSGIDPNILAECMTDIQAGGQANIWFALVTADCQLIGTPYLQFGGMVDVPTITPGTDTVSISLTLESKLVDLARPTLRRYTSADQRIYFPTDSAFNWVEQLNDASWNWGS